MHLFHSVVRGSARAFLHFFRRIAGMPSGPAAAVGLISSIALIRSACDISMLFIGAVSVEINGGCAAGILNTELYCSARIFAISILSIVISPVILLRSGPIFDLILLFLLA